MDIIENSALYGYLSPLVAYLGEHRYAALCGTAAVGLATLHQLNKSRGLPPGPRGWPVVGSSALMAGSLVELCDKLHKEYGNIVCLWLGGNSYLVILNGYETIKEAYVDRGNEFMDRQLGPIWRYIEFEDGVFSSPFNESYKANRKFCTQALRSSGFAKERLNQILAIEWEELTKGLDECTDGVMDHEKYFKWATTNAVCAVLYNRQLPHGDKDLDEMGNAVWNFLSSVMSAEAVQYLPEWVNNITQSNQRIQAKEATERVITLVQELILDHQSTYDENNIRDFVDMCLKEGILETKGLRHMACVCMTFMPDAVFTTTSVMMFIIMYLIHYPQHQARIRKEIKDELGESINGVTLNNREKLPFTDAFIQEVFRIVTPIATSVPNRPLQSTTFKGYKIPKHFDIVANIHGVHYDPTTYPEPNKFKPERFLENGKLKRVDQFFPFGIGRRRCMGEPLARNELFHYTANLVHRYEVCAPDGKLPDTTPQESSLAKTHIPFKVVLKKL